MASVYTLFQDTPDFFPAFWSHETINHSGAWIFQEIKSIFWWTYKTLGFLVPCHSLKEFLKLTAPFWNELIGYVLDANLSYPFHGNPLVPVGIIQHKISFSFYFWMFQRAITPIKLVNWHRFTPYFKILQIFFLHFEAMKL